MFETRGKNSGDYKKENILTVETNISLRHQRTKKCLKKHQTTEFLEGYIFILLLSGFTNEKNYP